MTSAPIVARTTGRLSSPGGFRCASLPLALWLPRVFIGSCASISTSGFGFLLLLVVRVPTVLYIPRRRLKDQCDGGDLPGVHLEAFT